MGEIIAMKRTPAIKACKPREIPQGLASKAVNPDKKGRINTEIEYPEFESGGDYLRATNENGELRDNFNNF